MFTDFFYILRKRKVPVSITEWMTLMEALAQGYIDNLDNFYFLARAILIKSEAYFDHYDVAFQEYFQGIETPTEIAKEVLEWLKNPLKYLHFNNHSSMFNNMDFDELLKELEKRLREQAEPHDGGSYWIGRGGLSPFGHSGYHPAGIRIGAQEGGRGAIQIAQQRRFHNYRHDLTLDIRQIKVALKGLRQLSRIGAEDELDLKETIKSTAQKAGEVELIWTKSRKNAVKVLLLMDVGGSMNPYAQLCSQLFSAAHSSSHFRDFQYYYFHNCIYDNVYKEDIERHNAVSLDYLLNTLETDYKVLLVGDAIMNPYELTESGGALYYYERNEIPSIIRLKQISDHFTHAIWLNPEDQHAWIHPTVRLIEKLFPMYPLTLEGLNKAVKKLVAKR
ncbi:VWA domain-containing protein [Chloroflexota bacterium]